MNVEDYYGRNIDKMSTELKNRITEECECDYFRILQAKQIITLECCRGRLNFVINEENNIVRIYQG